MLLEVTDLGGKWQLGWKNGKPYAAEHHEPALEYLKLTAEFESVYFGGLPTMRGPSILKTELGFWLLCHKSFDSVKLLEGEPPEVEPTPGGAVA